MERLTARYESGRAYVKEEYDNFNNTIASAELAKYEDTGLTPEEIDELKDENEQLKYEAKDFKQIIQAQSEIFKSQEKVIYDLNLENARLKDKNRKLHNRIKDLEEYEIEVGTVCEKNEYLQAENEKLKKENQGLRANSMIQETIIKRNGFPIVDESDELKQIIKDLIVEKAELADENKHLKFDYKLIVDTKNKKINRLTSENALLKKQLDKAVEDMKSLADDIRDKLGDDTCCGLCKHEIGDYNNQCPGFERDDCFAWRGLEVDNEV